MLKYITKRIIAAVITIFFIATLTFFLMHAVPGGPFLGEKTPSPQVLKALNAKYGLDKPLIVQYRNYMFNLAKLDLGPSISRRSQTVNEIVAEKFPTSAKLGVVAIAIALLFGIPMGTLAALKRGQWHDRLIMVIATLGIAVPGFVVATILLIVFGVKLHWLPTRGLDSPANYIMPAFALSFLPMSFITRLMRSSMLDVLNQDYIRTAYSKGLSRFAVIFKHALRNSILPVVTYLGPLAAGILTGGFVVENLFTIPGLGKFFIQSITARDYSLIMGVTIFLASLVILMNLLVDLAYVVIDPRIKLDK